MKKSIGILIPTWKAVKHLPHCLPPLIASKLNPRILVIDSSSKDGTIEMAQDMGVETLVISQAEFNHGTTRELGRKILGTDIAVMITQDAYACSAEMLEKLVQPLMNGEASVSYARQLPHAGAGFFEAFSRQFNYPTVSHFRDLEDVQKWGVYTFFCSNSCAAYLNTALDETGGFAHTLFGEDTLAVAKLLHRGHRVAYVAEAQVRHSHGYTLKEEFKRHFDIGLSRCFFRELIHLAGNDTQRGQAYVKAMYHELKEKNSWLLPYAFLQTLAKFTGYKIGQRCVNAPVWIKKKLSSQKHYW